MRDGTRGRGLDFPQAKRGLPAHDGVFMVQQRDELATSLPCGSDPLKRIPQEDARFFRIVREGFDKVRRGTARMFQQWIRTKRADRLQAGLFIRVVDGARQTSKSFATRMPDLAQSLRGGSAHGGILVCLYHPRQLGHSSLGSSTQRSEGHCCSDPGVGLSREQQLQLPRHVGAILIWPRSLRDQRCQYPGQRKSPERSRHALPTSSHPRLFEAKTAQHWAGSTVKHRCPHSGR
jgi:hypothetical protein